LTEIKNESAKEAAMANQTMFRRCSRGWIAAVAVALLSAPALARAHDRQGASGSAMSPEQVRIVQRALSDKGYVIEPTGSWDEGTRAALMSFQQARDLPQTGELDGSTSTALGVDPADVTPVSGSKRSSRNANADPAIDCQMNSTIDCRPGA
jgi:peptidoglycan hydrolase-like protein with peptidoglycan-binding domain